MKILLAGVLAMAVAQTAAIRFEPVQPDLFSAGGAFVNAWADFDDNSTPDVFVGFNGATPNRLYRLDPRQNGVGFADVAPSVGLAESRAVRAAAWGDFDSDGRPDLLIGYTPGSASLLKLYQNRVPSEVSATGPRAKFVDVTDEVGLTMMAGAVRQPVWVDFDGDGDLDLFVAFRDKPNVMFRNTRGKFADVAAEVGLADARKTVGAVWFDYDQDGDLDLYVANMDGDANGLFRSDAGHFTDVAVAAGVAWGGREPNDPASGTVRPCVADVNNDGRFDIFTANYGKNGLFLSKKDGTFADVSHAWGVDIEGHYDTCIVGDVNNDGRPDFYVNGTITGGVQYPDYLLINKGTRFDDETPANIRAINADHGAAFADVNRDGWLDLALTGSQANGMHSILANMTTNPLARSAVVEVVSPRGFSPGGAEIRALTRGTRELVASAMVDSGSGYNMQNAVPIVIGIGDRQVGQLTFEITWPAGGQRTVSRGELRNLPMGSKMTIPIARAGVELLFELAGAGFYRRPPVALDALPSSVTAAFTRYLSRYAAYKSSFPRPAVAGEKAEVLEHRIQIERNLFSLFGDAAAAATIARSLTLFYEWEGLASAPLGEAASADEYLAAHPKSIARVYLLLYSARLKICGLQMPFDAPTPQRAEEIRREIDRQLGSSKDAGHPLLSPVAAYLIDAKVCGLR